MKHKLAAGATPPSKSDLEFSRRASMLRGCRVSTLGPVLSAGIVGISFHVHDRFRNGDFGNQPWFSLEKISCMSIGFPIMRAPIGGGPSQAVADEPAASLGSPDIRCTR